MPIREPHELALAAWAKRAVEALELAHSITIDVIASSQPKDAPRAVKPYITQLLLTDQKLGNTPSSRTTDVASGSDFVTERSYQREGTVSFQSYGERHRLIIKALEQSTDDEALRRAADADGLTVSDSIGAITEPRASLEVGFEERSSIDFTFRYVETIQGTTPVIETVTVIPALI